MSYYIESTIENALFWITFAFIGYGVCVLLIAEGINGIINLLQSSNKESQLTNRGDNE